MKIVGYTVGTPLPKPNFEQTDPTKGDYIKGDILAAITTDTTLSHDGHVADAKAVGDKFDALVGDTAVSKQIEDAISALDEQFGNKADAGHNHDNRYYTETEIDTKLSGKSDTSHTHSAYVNQNAFSKVAVGSTTIEADNATDTLTLAAGSNITLTPDASGDKVTIAAKDTVYTHPASGVTAGTYKSVTVNGNGHVTAGTNPTTLSGYGITDAAAKTHGHDNATTTTAGFMSATDKSTLDSLSSKVGDESVSEQISTAIANKVDKVSGKGLSTNDYTTAEKNKLAGIASGAEVNQNAFSNIVVGNTTVAADAETDTLTLVAGSNVTITPDATNDKITIAATDTVYTHPTYTAKSSGLYKVTVDRTGHVSGTAAVAKSDITALGIPAQDTTYSAATTSAAGLMSASDKTKLEGIADGANKTVVDSSLSSTSTNPVQNKAVNAAITNLKALVGDDPVSEQISTAISGKSDVGHTHTAAEVGADVSGAAASALTSAKSYTDTKISDLINSAPSTLDTLGEIATAMGENADVVAALETAVGTKANASDLTSHTGNKSNPHGVTLSQLGVNATAAELNYVDGVTSSVQTQLNAKVPTSRKVNGKALSADITLSAGDVGADASGSASSALTSAKAYTDAEIAEWVGDKTVASQISTAIATKADSSHTHSSYVNQNAFSNVTVGSTTIKADSATDTLTIVAGSNITLTPDATNDKLTIAATDTVYTHPSYTARTGVPTANQTPAFGGTFSVSQPVSDATGHITAVNSRTVTIPSNTATTSAAGLMSADDKSKLDGIAEGANKITVDTALSSTSANPVQNKVVNTAIASLNELVGDTAVSTQITNAIASKADTDHTHNYAGSSSAGGAANSVKTKLTVKLNGGSTEGTNLFTYNGSTAKTVNITPSAIGAAASSHGNHVPATETANNAKFLRNDNTWQTVTPANIGAAASSHGTHVSYSTTAPVMDGTASVGSASTVARSDHKHPTDTSRAAASELTALKTLVGDTAVSSQISDAFDDAITALSVNGKVITYTKGDGTTGTITTQDTDTTYSAAGSSLGLVKSGGDVTISSGVITVKDDSHNHTIANVDNLQTSLDGKADKSQGIFYIEGAGTTDTTNKVATWTGTHSDITAYYDGLTILYKVATAGSTTTTLNINNLGAVTVVRNATTAISTVCPVDGVLLLTYTTDSSGTAYWKTADYDTNTKTTTGTSNKVSTKLYLAGATSQTSSGATTYSNKNVYIGTDNCLYSNGKKVATSDEVTAYLPLAGGILNQDAAASSAITPVLTVQNSYSGGVSDIILSNDGTVACNSVVSYPSGWSIISARDDATGNLRAEISSNTNTNEILFRAHCLDDASKFESYYLPAPSTGLTYTPLYHILTTKNAVAIEEGGTGAKTVSGALANFGFTQPAAMISECPQMLKPTTTLVPSINLNDGVYETGWFGSNGADYNGYHTQAFRSANYIPVEGGRTVCLYFDKADWNNNNYGKAFAIVEYDADKNITVARADFRPYVNNQSSITLNANTRYIRIAYNNWSDISDLANRLSELKAAVYYVEDVVLEFVEYGSTATATYALDGGKVVLTSPNGTLYSLSVSDSGTLSVTPYN